jgi:hypothetical protein
MPRRPVTKCDECLAVEDQVVILCFQCGQKKSCAECNEQCKICKEEFCRDCQRLRYPQGVEHGEFICKTCITL